MVLLSALGYDIDYTCQGFWSVEAAAGALDDFYLFDSI